MLEQIQRSFGYPQMHGGSELRNRKTKIQYAPLLEEDTVADLHTSKAVTESVPDSLPEPAATLETARTRQMSIFGSYIFRDVEKSPINAYILLRGMLAECAIDPLSKCFDGSEPFARLYLPSGQAEISVKHDVHNGLVQVDVHEAHPPFIRKPISKPTSGDLRRINSLMQSITEEIYAARKPHYTKEGINSRSQIVKFRYTAMASEEKANGT